MSKFKAGDLVYFPIHSGKVFTLQESIVPIYKVQIEADDCDYSLTVDGYLLGYYATPVIFHATEENRTLLEQLYGVEFEAPPSKPTGHEIIAAMLERGDELVPCMASDYERDWSFVLIKRVSEWGGYIDGAGTHWDCAKPIDPRTITEITELPE